MGWIDCQYLSILGINKIVFSGYGVDNGQNFNKNGNCQSFKRHKIVGRANGDIMAIPISNSVKRYPLNFCIRNSKANCKAKHNQSVKKTRNGQQHNVELPRASYFQRGRYPEPFFAGWALLYRRCNRRPHLKHPLNVLLMADLQNTSFLSFMMMLLFIPYYLLYSSVPCQVSIMHSFYSFTPACTFIAEYKFHIVVSHSLCCAFAILLWLFSVHSHRNEIKR